MAEFIIQKRQQQDTRSDGFRQRKATLQDNRQANQEPAGRSQPTMQLKKGVPVNDDKSLEREVDAIGARALTGGQDRNPVAQLGDTGRRGKEGLSHRILGSPTHGLRATGVAQLVTEEEIATSLRNIAAYAPNMLQHYGEATIRAVLSARNFRVRGHASGGSGDAQNAATTQDLETLTGYLQAYHPPSEEEEKASSSSSSGRKVGARHTEEEEKEAADKKADKKKAKAAKKKAAYEASLDPFGKRKPGGGGGKGGGKRGGGRGGGIGVTVK